MATRADCSVRAVCAGEPLSHANPLIDLRTRPSFFFLIHSTLHFLVTTLPGSMLQCLHAHEINSALSAPCTTNSELWLCYSVGTVAVLRYGVLLAIFSFSDKLLVNTEYTCILYSMESTEHGTTGTYRVHHSGDVLRTSEVRGGGGAAV